jgi:hypothetical protein
MRATKPKVSSMASALFDSIMSSHGFLIGGVSLVLAILSLAVGPTSTIALKWFWLLAIALATIIWLFAAALRSSLVTERHTLPGVLRSISINDTPELPILLVEPSDMYGTNTLVSLYFRETQSGFELSVGQGIVSHIQLDQKIQVQIENWFEGNSNILDGIRQNDIQYLSGLIVRPSVALKPVQIERSEIMPSDRVTLDQPVD